MSLAPSSMKHRAIVAGATGAIGRKCVQLLVLDPSVEHVTAVIRGSPKEPSFFDISQDQASAKLEQLKVDFSNLPVFPEGAFTVGLSALGVYTADVNGVSEFMEREHRPNLAIATAAAKAGAKTWAYLSGMGVVPFSPDARKPTFTPMFSFAKGRTEYDLATAPGFQKFTAVRPGGIIGRPEPQAGFAGFVEGIFNKCSVLADSPLCVHRDAIAKAMVQSILNPSTVPFTSLENEDIKRIAALYDPTSNEVSSTEDDRS